MRFQTLLPLAALILLFNQSPAPGAELTPEERAKAMAALQENLANGYGLIRSAQMCEDSGKVMQAINLYGQALVAYKKAGERGWPDAFRCLNSMGDLYQKEGHYEEAEDNYRQGLSVAVAMFGAGNDKLIPILTKLGGASYQQRKYPDAVPYLKQAYDLAMHRSGEDTQDVVALREKLADAYERAGDYAKSEPLLKQALAVREQRGESETPQTLVILDCYSDLLRKTNRDGEADQIDYRIDKIHNRDAAKASEASGANKPAQGK